MAREQPDAPNGERSQYEKGRFLTPTQRQYLVGEHDPPSENAETTMKSKIRARAVGGMRELGLVAREMDEKDRELIYEYAHPDGDTKNVEMPDGTPVSMPLDEDTPHGLWGNVGMSHEFESIFKFWYLTFRERGLSRDDILKTLELTIEGAEGEYRHGWPDRMKNNDVQATVEIETTDDVDLDQVAQKYESGSDLTPIQLKALEQAGKLSIDLSK